MTEPQVWTLIGVFTAIMLGGMTLMTIFITRATTSAIDGLRGEVEGKIGGLAGRFEALDSKIEGLRSEMNARFDAVNTRIDHLDRDVAAISRRVFGDAPRG